VFEDPDEAPTEHPVTPADRAKEKSDEFRMHAELVAVFEGHRKFEAEIRSDLDPELARDLQRKIGKLEKSKSAEHPILPPETAGDAAACLTIPVSNDLTTNAYHIRRRPGEVVIVRWLAGDEVDAFYERLQAHFDAALNHFRAEERQSLEWKQDPQTLKYLEVLDALEVKMPERYLRPIIQEHGVFVLSTQTADELDILHLSDYLMGVDAAAIVGAASAPPEEGATEQDRAWFFKLFSLRGKVDEVERMCFFAFLQKAEDTFEL
jgi:hypothetical protein